MQGELEAKMARENDQWQAEFVEHKKDLQFLVAARKELSEANKKLKTEIAQKKKAQNAMLQSEARFRAIFEFSGIGIARISSKGQTSDVNPTLEQILGYTVSELLSMNLNHLSHPEDLSQNQDLFKKLVKNQLDHYTVERRLKRKDGSMVWCNLTISRMETAGESLHFIAFLQDISKQKELEKELNERAREFARSNKELEQFAFTASHDLNEPLDKIVAFGRLLKDTSEDDLHEEGREYLNYMVKAAARMQNLISSLLKLSQVTTHVHPFQTVNMNEVVSEVCSDFKFPIEEKKAQIKVDELPILWGDPVQLHQLVQNLIGNALKFHWKDQPPMISIKQEPPATLEDEDHSHIKKTYHRISVTDKGIGFDTMHRHRIFDAFQRLHPKGQFEGTGMGLAICRKIAERHGGYLLAQSKPGEGATFTILLPQKETG